MISNPTRLYLHISHSKNFNLIPSNQVTEKSSKINGIKWHFEYVECSHVSPYMVNENVRSEHNEIQHACRFQNKFNLNTFIYGCVNDIISNSNHTMSSSYHKSLEVLREVWMRTPFF